MKFFIKKITCNILGFLILTNPINIKSQDADPVVFSVGGKSFTRKDLIITGSVVGASLLYWLACKKGVISGKKCLVAKVLARMICSLLPKCVKEVYDEAVDIVDKIETADEFIEKFQFIIENAKEIPDKFRKQLMDDLIKFNPDLIEKFESITIDNAQEFISIMVTKISELIQDGKISFVDVNYKNLVNINYDELRKVVELNKIIKDYVENKINYTQLKDRFLDNKTIMEYFETSPDNINTLLDNYFNLDNKKNDITKVIKETIDYRKTNEYKIRNITELLLDKISKKDDISKNLDNILEESDSYNLLENLKESEIRTSFTNIRENLRSKYPNKIELITPIRDELILNSYNQKMQDAGLKIQSNDIKTILRNSGIMSNERLNELKDVWSSEARPLEIVGKLTNKISDATLTKVKTFLNNNASLKLEVSKLSPTEKTKVMKFLNNSELIRTKLLNISSENIQKDILNDISNLNTQATDLINKYKTTNPDLKSSLYSTTIEFKDINRELSKPLDFMHPNFYETLSLRGIDSIGIIKV